MEQQAKNFYFSTRELILMAAFAAVGGVASTYINLIGDFSQSILGFAGTTQWAAGLHVMWLMLAAVIIQKPGAASMTGIFKGGVELFSGNTHGLLVVIVDILAGLLIDLLFLANRKGSFNIWYYLTAGIASASNIFVFQYFASIPADLMTFLVIAAASIGAFLSGIIFAGVLVRGIIASIQQAGLIPAEAVKLNQKKIWPGIIIALSIFLLLFAGDIYLKQQMTEDAITITGAVENPITLSKSDFSSNLVKVSASMNGIERTYTGVSIKSVIDKANPTMENGLLLIRAADGYSFFITLKEVYSNPNLIFAIQDGGDTSIVNVVGAGSQKAWVRGVRELIITEAGQGVLITGSVANPYTFFPDDWKDEMDSFSIDLSTGPTKLQGVLLAKIIAQSDPKHPKFDLVCLDKLAGEIEISVEEIQSKIESLMVFTHLENSEVKYVLGYQNGTVVLENLISIEVK